MQNKKLDVFISYSRADASSFVDELAIGLEIAGFQPLIDRQSISAAEEWKARISALIQQCDTVIVVITPGAVKSDILKWEIEEAIRRSKKIIPIEWLPTPVSDIPAQLAALNIIFFSSNASFAKGLKTLASALEDDLQWIREHTRLGERALEWTNQFNREKNALLLGKQIDDAEAWLAARPPNAPAPTPLHLEFISASRHAATERDSAERKRLAEIEVVQNARAEALDRLSRRTIYGLVGLAILAVTIGIVTYLVYLKDQDVKRANLRLTANMNLKIAHTDHIVYTTNKWFKVATDYKLAIGIITDHRSDSSIQQQGTGFLIRGKLLRSDYGDEPVLLTALHVLRSTSKIDTARFTVSFPAIEKQPAVNFKSISTLADLNVAVVRLSGRLPKDVVPIDQILDKLPPNSSGGIAVAHWTGNEGFSLGLGHILVKGAPQSEGSYSYTHVTGGGASGAPVFETDSGRLLCLHQSGQPQPPRPWGQCRSIATIIEAIAANKLKEE